jgi:hypothetical protein
LAHVTPEKRNAWILVGSGVVLLNVGERWRPGHAGGALGDVLIAAFLLVSVGGGLAALLIGILRLWRIHSRS